MINLIPRGGRKIVAKEYWFRMISLWLFLCAGALFMGTLLLAPSYFYTDSQTNLLAEAINVTKENKSEHKVTEEAIKAANELSTLLLTQDSVIPLTDVMYAIDGASSAGIEISSVKLEQREGDTFVLLGGTAMTRNGLAAFKSNIEAHSLFTSATIPIADLAQDVDLRFVITIEIADEKI